MTAAANKSFSISAPPFHLLQALYTAIQCTPVELVLARSIITESPALLPYAEYSSRRICSAVLTSTGHKKSPLKVPAGLLNPLTTQENRNKKLASFCRKTKKKACKSAAPTP
ncbi:MAG TPA: hypothetical protein VMW16_03770 [Sedimentisphaerales bacterium]|nr:hypothetical protein [Sedimentisphaerales bacterium]